MRYAEVISALARDPRRRAAMGEAALARTQTSFRIEQMGDRLTALLREAERMRRTAARPPISIAAAEASISAAIANARHQVGAAAPTLFLTQRLYFVFRRTLLPAYEWGTRRGWHWLVPLRDVVRGLLTRRVG